MIKSKVSKLLDHTPRQLYFYLRGKLPKSRQIINGRLFGESNPCVFVLSTGRVGTKTLTSLFDVAGSIFSHHEPSPRLFSLGKLVYQNFHEIMKDPLKQEILSKSFLTIRHDNFLLSETCGKGYVETGPNATFLAPIIMQAMTGVKFIHLIRDPRAVITSGMRRKWYNGHLADVNRIVPREASKASANWENLSPFKKNIWLWIETNRWIHDMISSLDEDRKLFVRAEDIFSGKEETMDLLFNFVGSPRPPWKKIHKILGKKLNAQKAGKFMEPSRWTKDMIEDLLTTAGTLAEKFGYEIESAAEMK